MAYSTKIDWHPGVDVSAFMGKPAYVKRRVADFVPYAENGKLCFAGALEFDGDWDWHIWGFTIDSHGSHSQLERYPLRRGDVLAIDTD